MKTMTASEASKEFGRYLDAAQRDPVVVTKKNRPVAVTVSFQDWEELTRLLVEGGLARGLDDLEHGRIEELGESATTARIARFRERSSTPA